MPARRANTRRAENAITPEAVAAYRAGDHLALHRALGLKPWQVSPLGAFGACPWHPGTGGGNSWPKAVELRSQLEDIG